MKNKVPKEVKSALEVLVNYCGNFKDCRKCGLNSICNFDFCDINIDKIIADNEEDK